MSSYGSGPDDPWQAQGGAQGGPPPGQPGQQPGQPGAPQYPSAPPYQEYPAAPPYGYGYAGGPGGPGDAPGPTPPLPPTVHWASILIFVRAGLAVLGVILTFARADEIVDEAVARSSRPVDPDAVRAGLLVFAVVFLIVLAFLTWLGVLIRRGKNWARVTTLVITGVGILLGLLSFTATYDSVTTVLNVLGLLLLIGIFVLLLMPASNAYFTAFKQQPRY